MGEGTEGHCITYDSTEEADRAYIRTRNALREVFPSDNGANSGTQDSASRLASEEAAGQTGTVVESLHPLGSEVGHQESQTDQQQN